jgi:hypothetical protein
MSKGHSTVNTLGHLFALHVTATDEQDRAQVEKSAEAVQEITGKSVEASNWPTWINAVRGKAWPRRLKTTVCS